jgi:hypothetical protein
MTRDQRQLMLLHRELAPVEACLAYAELLASPRARKRRKRFMAVSAVLKTALREPDDFVSTHMRRKHGAPVIAKWGLLAILVVAIIFEYRQFTIPVLSHWVREVLHRCGL